MNFKPKYVYLDRCPVPLSAETALGDNGGILWNGDGDDSEGINPVSHRGIDGIYIVFLHVVD